jgi:hypothetical protein
MKLLDIIEKSHYGTIGYLGTNEDVILTLQFIQGNLPVLSKFRKLLTLIEQYQIHDPSHKNTLINGSCHLQYPDQKVLAL